MGVVLYIHVVAGMFWGKHENRDPKPLTLNRKQILNANPEPQGLTWELLEHNEPS